jgi:hypothetical protein
MLSYEQRETVSNKNSEKRIFFKSVFPLPRKETRDGC